LTDDPSPLSVSCLSTSFEDLYFSVFAVDPGVMFTVPSRTLAIGFLDQRRTGVPDIGKGDIHEDLEFVPELGEKVYVIRSSPSCSERPP